VICGTAESCSATELQNQGTGTAAAPFRNGSVPEQKLRKAAQEFEAMLISNFWKAMTDSFENGDEDALDPGHSTFQDMGVQAMARELSRQGGFGLGGLILKHLEPLLQPGSTAKGGASE
jgi:Rod binding domain-containing protein